MEELEIFLNESVKKKNVRSIWHIYTSKEANDSVRKKAAKAYIKLSTNPVRLWKISTHPNEDKEVKDMAKEKLKKFKHPRDKKIKKEEILVA